MTVNDFKETTCATVAAAGQPTEEIEIESILQQQQSSPDLLGRVLAEFDGTTVLCRVCGDKASGFHYGVHSCEGCKGFFRRSIQQKIQYRPCTKNQQCSILRINRNRCQYCRLKKCIAVGMSRDAVRFGRVPKREKARILAAMQQSSNSRTLEKAICTELEDEQRLMATVVRAHIDTCDFTRDKVEPMLAQARDQPSYTACPPTLACPLNPSPQPLTGQQELLQDFSKRFSPAIRGVVEFAKRIPGFSLLAQDDQVTLLKAGVFEVLLVRLACMFDAQTSSMICLNGQVLKRDSIQNTSNARFLMDSMFDFAERINALRLTDAEIGLFCSIVVITPDRPGLRNIDLIEKIQNKLKTALQIIIGQKRHIQQTQQTFDELMKKVPDLRTLNTLHSEKLLAFKMTEQQQLQQQQQQHHIWSSTPMEDESNSKSPTTSSWSSASDVTMDEAKSPLGSVSSTESMCSSEITSLNDYHQQVAAVSNANSSTQLINGTNSVNITNAPLLAATLAGGLYPHRQRANSGSTSSGDDELATTSHLIHNGLTITPVAARPILTGSNTNSGATRFRKLDSPSDSGIESGPEKVDKASAPTSLCSSPRSSMDDHHIVEDMPVLKRVLQAPPLYDTNSLMDEAYKPHKKFRALRNNKDSAEAEPVIVMSPQPVVVPIPATIVVAAPSPPAANIPQIVPENSQLQVHHHHLSVGQQQPSSLSSTHSTLAKSLMEGPRMTAEQLKRTDIIHNYIMRDENSPMVTATPTSCPYRSNHHHHHETNASMAVQPPSWTTTSVITANRQHFANNTTTTTPPLPEYNNTKVYLYPQSPHSTSPTPSRSPIGNSPHSSNHIIISPPPPPPPPPHTATNILELQVDIASATTETQQPLNLSKKSPSPSPRPLKVVTLEV